MVTSARKGQKKNKRMTGSETCMCRTPVTVILSPYVLRSQKRGEIGMSFVRKFSKRVRHGRLRKIEKAIEIERKQSSRVTFEAELVTWRGELTMQKRRFARGSPRLSIASFKSFAGVITTMISVPRARIFIRFSTKTRSTRSQLRYYLRAIWVNLTRSNICESICARIRDASTARYYFSWVHQRDTCPRKRERKIDILLDVGVRWNSILIQIGTTIATKENKRVE